MSDNKGFESMRDLVRALQHVEYGLRTGSLPSDELDKACDHAREFYERLVVIRHKAREGRVRDQEKEQEMPKARMKKNETVMPAALENAEAVVKAPEPVSAAQGPARPAEPMSEVPRTRTKKNESVVPTPAPPPATSEEPVEAPEPVNVIEEATKPAEPVADTPTAKEEETVPVAAQEITLPTEPVAEASKAQEQEAAHVVAQETMKSEEAAAGTATDEAVVSDLVAAAPEPVEEQVLASAVAEVQPAPTSASTAKEPGALPQAVVPAAPEVPVHAELPAATSVNSESTEEKKTDQPRTASDYLKNATATPSPAPEMAAIRAQQIITRAPAPAASTVTVGERTEKARVNDLAKSISVSHKFWFTTELFGGDRGAYESGIARLNSAKDLVAARTLLENDILPKLKKPAHEEALNAIGELLQRRFE